MEAERPIRGSPHILFLFLATSWAFAGFRTTCPACWGEKYYFPGDFHGPHLNLTFSLREAWIFTQQAGWHPLPVLRTSATITSCYLTPLSASGIQEHIRLLGKMMFCKSKPMRPELTVTLAAVCTVKHWAFLMASGIREPGKSSSSSDNQPIDKHFGDGNSNLPRL